jgi:hypothetical protein
MALPRTPQSGTWATNDAITTTKLNADGGGIAGLAENTSNQGSITTDTILTSSTITWTAVAGRVYKHTVTMMVTISAATNVVIKILDGSSTELYRFDQHFSTISSSDSIAFSWYERGITAASTTRKLSVTVGTGTGGIQGATAATQYAIEDVGPS